MDQPPPSPDLAAIEQAIAAILAGADPKEIKAGLDVPPAVFEQYLAIQRDIISTSHDRILELLQARIAAAQRVAVEKYLAGDTIHKPFMEDRLFSRARHQARRVGLPPETAEDVARLVLAKAREVQERTLNDIAARLSQLHGEILDAESVQPAETDIGIPSHVVRTGDQPLARETALIKEFRLTGLSHEYPDQQRAFLDWFETPPPLAAKGMLAGSRDNDLFLQALLGGDRCVVMASLAPTGPLHVGQGALIDLLAHYQRLGAQVVLTFNDMETVALRGQQPAAAAAAMRDILRDCAALGLDVGAADVYAQSQCSAVAQLAYEVGAKLRVNIINSALGLRLSDSVSATFLPLIYAADILYPQRSGGGGRCRTQVIGGLERDVYVRLARNLAESCGFYRPAGLYVRAAKSLTTYVDPRTAAAVDVMHGGLPQGALFYRDDPAVIRRKVMTAVTGGRATVAEHRRLGGNPDPRVCSVSSLMALQAVPAPDEYAAIQQACRSGQLLCKDCKARTADRLVEQLAAHRTRRAVLGPETTQRIDEIVNGNAAPAAG